MKSLRWNKRLLKYLGIWPLEIYDPLFFFTFIYLSFHCCLTFANLIYYKIGFSEILDNFTENVLFIMTLTKITICRINRKSLAQLLLEIENSLIDDDYNTSEKKFILIKYTKLAKYYFLTAFISMTLAIGLYFIVGILPNIKIAIRNSSLGYTLPYKTRVIINIDDTKVYFCVCLYQMLMVPIIIIGYVGFDCLFTHLAFHISAQFGILSCRVREILDDCNSFQFNMKALVFRHYKLIRQAETLEDNFSVMILQQLMGTTFHLCISGYYALIGSVKQEGLTLTLFIAYAFSVLSTLFIYCYIGECLIQESTSLSNAFYRYEWYNISPINLKMIYICMLRMKKPQQLTSGKFFVLSLATFTDIIKTSMGYLSLLRNVL